jgi:hypothetical protein
MTPEFTTIGVIALAFVVLETANDELGSFYVLLLAAIIVGLLLINYKEIIPIFVKNAPGVNA